MRATLGAGTSYTKFARVEFIWSSRASTTFEFSALKTPNATAHFVRPTANCAVGDEGGLLARLVTALVLLVHDDAPAFAPSPPTGRAPTECARASRG